MLIGLCVVAIPVGLFAKRVGPNPDDGTTDNSWAVKFNDRIQIISIEGTIEDDDRDSILSIGSGSSSTVRKLEKALKNKKVKGVLLRINSPGGTIGASQELNDAVKKLKKEKPVVVSMGDTAASGGYYVACAADKIFANPGTLTGSIGVIISMVNIKDLADKIGIQPKIVKSGPFKDITSMYRPMTEEEKAILQELISDNYDQFVTAVSEGRSMKKEEVKKIADGRVYSGRQALALKLIDKLGTKNDALTELQNLCKKKFSLEEDLPVDYGSSGSILGSLLSSSAQAMGLSRHQTSQESLVEQILPVSMHSRFQNQPLWLMQ